MTSYVYSCRLAAPTYGIRLAFHHDGKSRISDPKYMHAQAVVFPCLPLTQSRSIVTFSPYEN